MGAIANLTSVSAMVSPAPLLLPNHNGFSNGGGSISTANAVNFVRVYIPFRLTVVSLGFRVGTGVAGTGAVGLGIYNSDGTTKILDTGIVAATGVANKSIVLGTAVTLEPGTYLFAWTANSATISLTCMAPATNVLNAGTVVNLGTAANAGSAGALPSTLGTLTAAQVSLPLTCFQT